MRPVLFVFLIVAMLFSFGCGGGSSDDDDVTPDEDDDTGDDDDDLTDDDDTTPVDDDTTPVDDDTTPVDDDTVDDDTSPVPPTIVTSPDTSSEEGSLWEYDVDATGDPTINYTLRTFGACEKPTGMSIDNSTGLVEWTPSNSQSCETYHICVRAQNGAGSDDQEFDLTPDKKNQAPDLSLIHI